MSSGLLETPAGEQLCVFLLRAEDVRKREVACQWEGPPEERREVGCQSEVAERRDAAVQVDLLTQQLGWGPTGSSAVLLQCFAVRPDGPDGGALLQHCTSKPTRTRPIQPAAKRQNLTHPPSTPPSSSQVPSRTRTRKRRALSRDQQLAASSRRSVRRRKAPAGTDDPQQEGEEPEEVLEEDKTDPTWAPPEADTLSPTKSQHASLRMVKQESDGIMCNVCGKVMKNKSSLARHLFIHTGKKPYGCHLCELRFNRHDNLQHHLNRLHPNGVAKLEKQRKVQTWLCEVCGKTFNCMSRLKTHEVIHSGVKPFHCDLCSKAYMRLNDLEHHKKVVHVGEGGAAPRSGSLLCHLCGKEFKYKSQLAAHFQTHSSERPHICDVCGRKFGRLHQLKRHKVLAHVERADGEGGDEAAADAPFSCDTCGKRLKSEALLAAHSRIHTDDKPHRCSICPRSFHRLACLKLHHRRVHLKIGVSDGARRAKGAAAAASRAFPCPVCSKVFKFKSLLASHSVVHSEARPHACDFCSRSFRRFSHLKRHREVVHANGARPPQSFVCHICGKDKKCRSQLARHVMIHTGERPFGCDLCAARFNRRGNLQQHMKRMHGVGKPPADEAPPLLFEEDVDMMPALTYKQEETVVAVDAVATGLEDTGQVDAT